MVWNISGASVPFQYHKEPDTKMRKTFLNKEQENCECLVENLALKLNWKLVIYNEIFQTTKVKLESLIYM